MKPEARRSYGKKRAYEDEEKVYLPAEKGKAMVAMDKRIEKVRGKIYKLKRSEKI